MLVTLHVLFEIIIWVHLCLIFILVCDCNKWEYQWDLIAFIYTVSLILPGGHFAIHCLIKGQYVNVFDYLNCDCL